MFKKIIRYSFYWFYLFFSANLPANYRPLGKVFKTIRSINASLFLKGSGKFLNIEKNAKISPDIIIGDYSMLGENCRVYGGVSIGKNVLMGPDVKIYTRNHRFSNRSVPIRLQGDEFKPVYIGDDSWLGANVVILPGVEVGKGVVVGAGSIVTKSVRDYCIVAGNPAREIGYRSSEE